MPNPHLYLHEVIRIVGTGSEAYKRHTGEGRGRGPHSAGLVGTWQQSGSTGDWPCVVNLWEMRGWEHWAELLEYQYAGGDQPAELRAWWTEATQWRSGGFDRILEPAAFSPTRQELIDRNVRGRAFVQEIATVRAGLADAYLDAVASHWLPVAARRGLVLVGAWRTAMRDTEAVLLWALPTFGDIKVGLGGDYAADCYRLCGNAANPVITLSYEGSHADNFNELVASTPAVDDAVLKAYGTWGDALVAKYGEDAVDNNRIPDNLGDVAARVFAPLTPTTVRVGQHLIPTPG